MSTRPGWYRDLTRFDRSALSAATGLRAGVFVSIPILVGILAGQLQLVYCTLGALFLVNTEGPLVLRIPLRVLLVASFTEAAAFGLGTVAGTLGYLAVPIGGLGIFLMLLSSSRPRWTQVGTFTAMIFAVGIGLPGGSVSTAWMRVVLSLAGALWGLGGVALHRLLTRTRPLGKPSGTTGPSNAATFLHSESFVHAAVVGIASTLGLAIGFALGLARDFWIVVTIIIAVRQSLVETRNATELVVLGTLAGAAVAALVTVEVTNDYVLWLLMLLFAVGLYATRGANIGLTQFFVAPFIIILLNIVYPGHWQLAEVRILDVALGGALAVLSVYALRIRKSGKKS